MRKFKVDNHGGELRISWRWQRAGGWFILLFGLFWTSITGSMALGVPGFGFIPFLFSLIGIFTIYLGIVFQVNTTSIHVSHHQIAVDHKPLPWFGNKTIMTQDIDQLFVIEGGYEKANGNTTILFAVKAKMKNGDTIELVNSIPDRENALVIERRIEEHLNIRDEAVHKPFSPKVEAFLKKFPQIELPSLPQPINEGKLPSTTTEQHRATTTPKLLQGLAGQDPFALQQGDPLKVVQQDFHILHHYQYDWADGRSDVGYLLQNEKTATNIYAEQAGTRYLYFEERPLLPDEAEKLGFLASREVPSTFKNVDDKFYHRNEVIGVRHLDHGQESLHCRQWIYFATTTQERFRVLRVGQLMKLFIQAPISVDNLKIKESLKVPKKRNS